MTKIYKKRRSILLDSFKVLLIGFLLVLFYLSPGFASLKEVSALLVSLFLLLGLSIEMFRLKTPLCSIKEGQLRYHALFKTFDVVAVKNAKLLGKPCLQLKTSHRTINIKLNALSEADRQKIDALHKD